MSQMARIPILISGSTVHEHYLEGGYPGDQHHVDYLTSPGAKIEDLEHMWRLDYADENKPMDILLIGGLNNFKNDSVEQMMTKFKNFNNTVMSHSDARHPATNASTFRVATLLLAPQFVWFDDNGDMPGYPYVNNMEKMAELNKQITILNNQLFNSQVALYRNMNNGVAGTIDKAPLLNRFGVRTKWIKDKTGEAYHVTSHRWSHWREKDCHNMLHLSDKLRNKLAQHAAKYLRELFSPDFSPPPAWAPLPTLAIETSSATAASATATSGDAVTTAAVDNTNNNTAVSTTVTAATTTATTTTNVATTAAATTATAASAASPTTTDTTAGTTSAAVATASAASAATTTTNAGLTLVQQPTTSVNNNMDIDVSEETDFFEVRIDSETVEQLLYDLEKRTGDV